MGGGKSKRSAYYGKERKMKLTLAAIYRTTKIYGINLRTEKVPELVMLNDKTYKERFGTIGHGIGFYQRGTNIVYLNRKYYAGKQYQSVITHETIHGLHGDSAYQGPDSVSGHLEEGATEYITQGTMIHGYKGRGAKYARGWTGYEKQVDFASMVMKIVGRKKYFSYWRQGFNYINLTKTLEAKKQDLIQKERAYVEWDKLQIENIGNPPYWVKRGELNLAHMNADIAYDKQKEKDRNYNKLANDLGRKGYKKTAQELRKNYRTGDRTKIWEILRKEISDKGKWPKDEMIHPDNMEKM